MRFGVIVDQVFEQHRNPDGHPESPARIRAILTALEGWERNRELVWRPPQPIDRSWLEKVHTATHLERIQATSGQDFVRLDADTSTSAESYQVALQAAGSAVELVKMLLAREIDSGFALVRPPGHHAERGRAMGFCLFNNIAVAAVYALSQAGIDRVAVVDFDVHHGNGTQEIFYAHSDVLYLSTHQYPLFPGTGLWGELGTDQGRGYTVNLPVSAGVGNSFFVPVFRDLVIPILRQYRPDLILVSAGYDAHRDDPLAGLELDETGFRSLVEQLNAVAGEVCSGRILFVLEGGYNLVALANCVLATMESTLKPSTQGFRPHPPTHYLRYRNQVRRYIGEFWDI